MQGWVKVYREILENATACKSAEHFTVLMYLQLKATHKEINTTFAGKAITLKAGQIITGRRQIAERFNMNESKVQRILKDLEHDNLIQQITSNKNRLITVNAYCEAMAADQKKQQEQQQEKHQQLPLDAFISAWNELGVGKIKKIVGKRLQRTNAIIQEYSIEDYFTAIANISKSGYLHGNNERNWIITYDWFVELDNFYKVLEGQYNITITPRLNTRAYGDMLEHGDLLEDIDELETKYIDKKLKGYRAE